MRSLPCVWPAFVDRRHFASLEIARLIFCVDSDEGCTTIFLQDHSFLTLPQQTGFCLPIRCSMLPVEGEACRPGVSLTTTKNLSNVRLTQKRAHATMEKALQQLHASNYQHIQ